MKRYLLLSILAVLAASGSAAAARAQAPAVVANYSAGWNMVGGPPGTDFSSSSVLYTYAGGGYLFPITPKAGLCLGYWAFFTSPTTIALPTATGPSQSCALQAGWNMVGNPFSGIAQLPPQVTAYHWNPDANKYDIVHAIPPGASVWINAPGATSITLLYLPTVTPAASTLVISDITSPGPYRVHVGDNVELLLPSVVGFTANAGPAYLHLESAGFSGPLSCIGEPSCALSLVNQFWIWRAVAPGVTFISVAPVCIGASPPCGHQIQYIEIDIVS